MEAQSDLLEKESEAKIKYPLNTIYFYLTEGCNLACRHCWITPKFQSGEQVFPSLPLELFKSIIKQAKLLGLSGVKLTGGEPFLHPQINEILDFIQQEELGLTIETNGVLCTAELCRKVKSGKNPFVSVSLDGADAETHEWVRGVKGSFEDALRGVRNLVEAGIRPQIIMSIMKRNKDQMEAVVRLAESLGAESVKFNLVQPTARGEQMHKQGETPSIEELVELGLWVERELTNSTKLRLIYSHPAAFKPLSRILGGNQGCGTCGIKGIIGVLANGSYALCGIGESVSELIFGDATKDLLQDVWETNVIIKQLRKELPDQLSGICMDCVLKNRCLGFCPAQNYYSSKNLLANFWFCAEAREKNLFPESRKVLRRRK